MARYTIELGELIQRKYDLGLDDYPIFDENYRSTLNTKLLEHYFFYEIGQETPDRFRFMLNRTMREIMPRYNEMYQIQMLDYNPLVTEYTTQKEMRQTLDESLREGASDTVNLANESGRNSAKSKVEQEDTSNTSGKTTGNETVGAAGSTEKTTTTDGTTGEVVDENGSREGNTTADRDTTQSNLVSDTPLNNLTTGQSSGFVYDFGTDYANRLENVGTKQIEDNTTDETAQNHRKTDGTNHTVVVEGGTSSNDSTTTNESNNESKTVDNLTNTTTNFADNARDSFGKTHSRDTGKEYRDSVVSADIIREGRNANPSELINSAYGAIVNIDMLVITDPEIERLFMGVY